MTTAKPRVYLLTTGGTIASVSSGEGGANPLLQGHDLLAAVPGVEDWADITVEAVAQMGGSHLDLETISKISRRVNEIFIQDSVVGVVVTQGTDTIDETAYLLSLTTKGDRPVVVTGAMRNPSMLGADGPKNLHDALRVVTHQASRGRETMVVFNDEIHSARMVEKSHTQSPAAFVSSTGPIGHVVGTHVHFRYDVNPPARILPPMLDKRVEILKVGIEPSVILLRACIESDVRGIVIEGLGGGRFPPYYAEVIAEAIRAGRYVVITSRAGRGRIWDPYGYEGTFSHLKSLGVIFGHDLSSPKLRIRLMLALPNLESPGEIREYMENE